MTDQQHTTNWPDLAIGLYDRLTGRNAARGGAPPKNVRARGKLLL